MTVDIFEKATRSKLRFETGAGFLGAEDLWDLPLSKLNVIAVGVNREIKESGQETFLLESSSENETLSLQFDIVLHILNTKKNEKELRSAAAEKAATKQKLLAALQRKEDAALEDMSAEDIRAEIDKL